MPVKVQDVSADTKSNAMPIDTAPAAETGRTEHQTVVFHLGEEQYGVDIFRVNEIIRMKDITPIPGSDPHIEGLINLRGKTIPVVRLSGKLGLTEKEATEDTRIIVVETDQEKVGLIVDAVAEVLTVTADDLEDTPALVADQRTDYVWSLAKRGDRIITLLHLDNALAA